MPDLVMRGGRVVDGTDRQAACFGIGDRGVLAPGFRADLAGFDLDARI